MASSGSTVIGENTGVFVGGLPENFTVFRRDSGNSDSRSASFQLVVNIISRFFSFGNVVSFCKCLKDSKVKQTISHFVV